jgi:NADH:ubiquinone oxidoreductase subunit F (NADH-binding)
MISCRIGTRRLSEIGDRVATGRPRPTDLDLLADLAHDIVESGLCDHERLATLPYTSGMRYFRSELDDHILRSSCPAGVCHPIAVAAAAGTR